MNMKLHYDKDHQHVFVDTCSKEFAASLARLKTEELVVNVDTRKFVTVGPSLEEVRKQGGWRS